MFSSKYKFLILLLAGFVLLFSFALTQKTKAYTTAGDIAECERRNLVYGCNCTCNDPNLNQVCVEQPAPKPGICQSAAPGLTKTSTSSSGLQLNPFPSVGSAGGVIVLDANGDVWLTATIANILKWFFWVVAAIAVALGFYGSYMYSTAGASDDKAQQAQKIITNALIGFVIVVAGLLIVMVVSRLAGFDDKGVSIDKSIDNSTKNTKDQNDQDNFFNNLFK